jgi:hypothetical protein
MEWLDPWSPLKDDEHAEGLKAEFLREVGRGHALFGVPVLPIAKRAGSDDVLFQLLDGSGRVAVVHLTWVGGRESPPWPGTAIFSSLEAWCDQDMRPTHEDFLS